LAVDGTCSVPPAILTVVSNPAFADGSRAPGSYTLSTTITLPAFEGSRVFPLLPADGSLGDSAQVVAYVWSPPSEEVPLTPTSGTVTVDSSKENLAVKFEMLLETADSQQFSLKDGAATAGGCTIIHHDSYCPE
jgi:hypothetical protein